MTKLGERQKGVLRALRSHGGYPGGWTYGSDSQTVRVLDSLVARGLVTGGPAMRDTETGAMRRANYRINDDGRKALEEAR